MRLPWPSRRTARPDGAAAAPAATGGARPTDAPLVRRSEWRDVGSLQPSFQAHLGVSAQRFGADLSSSQRPDPILQPLGHERAADGPAGLVSGLTRPVVARVQLGFQSASGSLPLARTRRTTLPDAAPEPDSGVPLPSQTSVAAGGSELPVVTPRRLEPITGTPAQRGPLTVAPQPSVARGMSQAPLVGDAVRSPGVPASLIERPMDAPATALPTRTILRTAAGSRVRLGPALDTTPTGTPDLTGVGRSVVARTATRSAAGRPDAASPQEVPVAQASAHTAAVSQRPGIPGTQSDISSVPWSPPRGLVVARVATSHPSSSGRAATSAIGSPASTGFAGPVGRRLAGSATGEPSVMVARAAGNAPRLPVVGSRPLKPTDWPLAPGRGATGAGGGMTPPEGAPTGPAGDTPTGVPLPLAPLAPADGSAGVAPGLASGSRHGSAPSQEVAAQHGDAIVPVIQRRAVAVRAGTTPAPVVHGEIRGMTRAGHVTIPAAIGPLDRGAGRAVLAHEQVHARQQRALGDQLPAPGSESAHRLEADARRVEAAVAWEELTLARPPAHAAAAIPPDDIARPVERLTPSVTQGSGFTAARAIQHAAGDAPPPAPDSSGGPGAGGGNGPSGAATPPSDRDLDEMLRRLYPRLRRQLSSELLVARERAGVLADRR